MRAILALIVILACGPGAAACDTMNELLDGNVVGAPDGATLILSNGEKLRLSGIQAPKLSADGDASMNWPLAEDARALLAALTKNARIALEKRRKPRDRHGRLIGQAFLADGTWLQAGHGRRLGWRGPIPSPTTAPVPATCSRRKPWPGPSGAASGPIRSMRYAMPPVPMTFWRAPAITS